MSRLMNALENPADTWYLKTPDGGHYGPVTLATLQRWAGQGRVMPGALLSHDQQKWKPAHLLDALAMDCVVRTSPNSFFGPIHANAVDIYIRDGIIPANSAVYASRASDATRFVEKLETQFKDEHASRQHEAFRESENKLAAALAERDAARQSAVEFETRLREAGAEIQRLAAALADAETLHADAEARFQESLRDLESSRRETDGLRVELELLRDKQASTRQSLADNEAALNQFRDSVQNFNDRLRRLSDECAGLQPPEPPGTEPPQPFAPGEDAAPRVEMAAFDPTAPVGDSPLACLEAQVRAELAHLKSPPAPAPPAGRPTPVFSFSSLFKKTAPQ